MAGKAIFIPARPLTENPRGNQSAIRIRGLNFERSRPSTPQLESPPQLPKFRRRLNNSIATQPPEITADANTRERRTPKGPDKMPVLSPQSYRSTRILTTAGPTRNDAERLAMRAHRFLNLPPATKITGTVMLRSSDRPASRRVVTEPNFLESKSEVPLNDIKLFMPTDVEAAKAETQMAEVNYAGCDDNENGDNNGNQDGECSKQNGDTDGNENGDNDDNEDGHDDDQNGEDDNHNVDGNDNQNSDNDVNQNGDNVGNQNGDNDNQNGHRVARKVLIADTNEFSGLDTDDTVEMSLEFRKKLEAKVLQKEQAEKIGLSGGSSPEVSTEVSSNNDEPLVSSDLCGSGTAENTVGVITRSRTRDGGNGSRHPARRVQADDGFSYYRHIHWKKLLLITYLRGEIGNASGERAAEKAALERIRNSWEPLKSHPQRLSSGRAAVKRKRQVSSRRQVTTEKKMKK